MITKQTLRTAVTGITGIVLAVGIGAAPAGGQEVSDKIPRQEILQNTANSFVLVQYHLKKSDRPQLESEYYYFDEDEVRRHILSKQTLDYMGVIVSDKGEVYAPEPRLRPDVIDKVTIKGPDGKELPAQKDRLLTGARGVIVRIAEPLPDSWQALKFAEAEKIDGQTKLYTISPYLNDPEVRWRISPALPELIWKDKDETPVSYALGYVNHVGVICSDQGQPVGLSTDARIDLSGDGPAWKGGEVLADAGITAQQQEQLEKKIDSDFAQCVYEIKITFRQPPREEEEYDISGLGGIFGSLLGGEAAETEEITVFGLGFAENKLLIPTAMPQMMVAGIDNIKIVTAEETLTGTFEGVLRRCEATVIEITAGKLPQVVSLSDADKLVRTKPFWTVFVRELAGKDLSIDYNRWIEKTQGYADQWYRRPERPLRRGSWLLDGQGRLAGLFTRARHELDRLKPYLMGEEMDLFRSDWRYQIQQALRGISYSYVSEVEDQTIFEADELAEILNDLPANLDPFIRHLSEQEQKERVWLGVEYTRITKEMAEQMQLRKQTEDGRVGLMINRVYADSPAARLGITEGDVLLKLLVPATDWPIELKASRSDEYSGPDWEDIDIPQQIQAMGGRAPRKRPWPSRNNSFTRMLKVIGQETPVTLTYLHNGEQIEKEFVIEKSPPDALSAEKFKDDKLGLTVKDLTYEVRAALFFPSEAAAIVISKVEQGTPAALGRINTFELICAVDGADVGSVKQFEEMIEKAQEQNKESVRLTVEWLGKTRLADLKIQN
ncbi:MAG: hypothetical protein AMJ79_15390 [Phycisphaerae bacterium SM23_30]|nr:MAG: hypothetical protein AMJ79_15390 [Phycisphaerae bacterium SM23_30]